MTVIVVIAILALIVLVMLVAGVTAYRRLVRAERAVAETWAAIDAELRRRHDLVPELVRLVAAGQERGVLEAVDRARATAVGAKEPRDRAVAESTLTRALRSLAEGADGYAAHGGRIVALRAELAAAEDRIDRLGTAYNEAVIAYNAAIQARPANIVAGMTGFTRRDLFQARTYAAT
ncbi:LemA protein [Thermocatellispora tengchongensis]|uniref:LemA protein n=1 Tax=Thermocatellispora tengchongensis TaxID=1073253 RepID=A0A840PND0_9ACTN|nr:LemA family protein [Thermocatellispora tengchongensis]MBB5138557.1 LemA protein [Thermocatellispora tengchongensis]